MVSYDALSHLLFGQAKLKGLWANLSLLLLRLYGGITIMMAGLDKLPLPDWMVDQVIEIGFPFPTFFAWMACFSEFAFGALLCLGLLTRLSGFMLAFTMGVASFGFQDVTPLLDMHIAQHFFWIFFLFMIVGAGRFSLDHFVYNSTLTSTRKVMAVALPVLLLAIGTGLTLEFRGGEEEMVETETEAAPQIFLAGSFNNWDPAINPMAYNADSLLYLDIPFEKAGPVQFKFTVDASWDTNLGIIGQSAAGFPLNETVIVDEGNTENIRAYIPAAGTYRFTLNPADYTCQLDSVY